MRDQRLIVCQAQRRFGAGLGVGLARTERDETHAWTFCLNLPALTVTVWFWRRDLPYYCPASGNVECCPRHSGWDHCCDRPDDHRPIGPFVQL